MRAAQPHAHCTCECHHPTDQPCGDGVASGKVCAGGPCRRCGGESGNAHCPPPPYPCHEGTISFPPHQSAPTVTVELDPNEGRPGKGDPGESGWFGIKIKGYDRGRPSFGPRKNEYLPYLVIRSNPGDRGSRPVNSVFWESPDIFVASGIPAANAPLMPPTTAGVATVGAPTTLYAHVWNLGRAPVWGAYVEFSWFNPSLGFSYASAHRIGAAMVDLGDRFTSFESWREVEGPAGDRYLSRGSHAIVRCPVTWSPTWENNGHECLVVRVFEPFMDNVALTNYDARIDRHVGQRNIAVVEAHSPAEVDLLLDVAPSGLPGRAEIEVIVDDPNTMPWLQLYKGRGNQAPLRATGEVTAGLLPPTIAGTRRIDLAGLTLDARAAFLSRREHFDLGCDPVQIGLHAAADLEHGQAHVVRVRQRLDGTLIGGYTVVLMKS
jgi:hypothetical protein